MDSCTRCARLLSHKPIDDSLPVLDGALLLCCPPPPHRILACAPNIATATLATCDLNNRECFKRWPQLRLRKTREKREHTFWAWVCTVTKHWFWHWTTFFQNHFLLFCFEERGTNTWTCQSKIFNVLKTWLTTFSQSNYWVSLLALLMGTWMFHRSMKVIASKILNDLK